MLKKSLKSLAAALITGLFGLVLLEVLFRAFLLVWPPIYQALYDDKNKQYLYIVGESTAEGVQYQTKINPAILVSYQFNDSLNRKPIEIIPLALSGRNIDYHYFTLFSELLLRPHKNGLVLVYSGVNDAFKNGPASYDFYRWRLFQHSVILSKLSYLFGNNSNCPQKYEYRYHQLIHLAKQHHFKIVLSQLVGNVSGYDPEIFADDALLKTENAATLHSGKQAFFQNNFKTADSIFTALGNLISYDQAHLIYFRGKCKYEMEQYDSACILLNYACEIQGYLGFSHWKNAIIERVANEEKITVAHTYDRFADSSEHRLVGYNLINDAHHPNLKGYCIMADEISRQVSKLYGDKIINNISPEIIATRFKFDDDFCRGVYYRLIEWFIFECVETQEREIRLSRLKFYLDKYEQLGSSDSIIIVWKMLIGVLENNRDLFVENLHAMNALQNKDKVALLHRLQVAFIDKPDYRNELRAIILKWPMNSESDKQTRNDVLAQLP